MVAEREQSEDKRTGRTPWARWWATFVAIAGVIGVFARYEKAGTYLARLLGHFAHFLAHPNLATQLVLLAIAVGGLGILGVGARKKERLPRWLVGLGWAGALLPLTVVFYSMTISAPERVILVVYDRQTQPFHATHSAPSDIRIEGKCLDDIPKLAQLGELTSSTAFLSLVDRPVAKWGSLIDLGSLNSVIFSAQEVLEPGHGGKIVDISVSSFAQEIAYFLQSEAGADQEVAIFFEREYQVAEAALATHLRSAGSWPVHSIVYDSSAAGSRTKGSILYPHGGYAIFLGSANGLEPFLDQVAGKDDLKLILPGWLRPHVKVASDPSEPDAPSVDPRSPRGYLIVSSTFNSLVEGDSGSWGKIYGVIAQALTTTDTAKSGDAVKARILEEFARSKTVEKVVLQ